MFRRNFGLSSYWYAALLNSETACPWSLTCVCERLETIIVFNCQYALSWTKHLHRMFQLIFMGVKLYFIGDIGIIIDIFSLSLCNYCSLQIIFMYFQCLYYIFFRKSIYYYKVDNLVNIFRTLYCCLEVWNLQYTRKLIYIVNIWLILAPPNNDAVISYLITKKSNLIEI